MLNRIAKKPGTRMNNHAHFPVFFLSEQNPRLNAIIFIHTVVVFSILLGEAIRPFLQEFRRANPSQLQWKTDYR